MKNKSLFIKKSSFARWERGQALITLLFFMIIGLTITSAAIVMIMVNSLSGTKQQQGELAYQLALSGIEEAKLRLLRSTSYTGETFSIDNGTAAISVSGDGTAALPYSITSTGTLGSFIRKVQVQAKYVDNSLTVTSQKESF